MEDRDAFQAAQNSLLFLHLNLSHGNTQLKHEAFSNACSACGAKYPAPAHVGGT